jgi:hypothetical protein
MLVGLALAASVGCGGGGSNDEDEIKNVLTTSFTTVDPAQCQQLTEKGTGLSVDGDQATAKVTPQGGSLGGADVTVALANQDGWKIDGFDDIKIVGPIAMPI